MLPLSTSPFITSDPMIWLWYRWMISEWRLLAGSCSLLGIIITRSFLSPSCFLCLSLCSSGVQWEAFTSTSRRGNNRSWNGQYFFIDFLLKSSLWESSELSEDDEYGIQELGSWLNQDFAKWSPLYISVTTLVCLQWLPPPENLKHVMQGV